MWYPISFASVTCEKEFKSLLHEIEKEFETMKWKKYTRTNVSSEPCNSMPFGEVMRPYHGRCESSCNKKFPKVYSLLQKLSALLKFTHSSYTINKNLTCLPHKDKNNVGNSLILSLGKFSGGNLIIEGVKFDIYHRPLLFNGAKCTHWTEPFQGTRYTIVFYNIKAKQKKE